MAVKKRKFRHGKPTRGVLVTAAAVGTASIPLIVPSVSGDSPLTAAQRGDIVGAVAALQNNMANPGTITAIIPPLILTLILAVAHRKFGRTTKISRHWSAV